MSWYPVLKRIEWSQDSDRRSKMLRRFFHYLKDGSSGKTFVLRKREDECRKDGLYESIARGNTLIELEKEALRLLERH
jgi:hypothetical protein